MLVSVGAQGGRRGAEITVQVLSVAHVDLELPGWMTGTWHCDCWGPQPPAIWLARLEVALGCRRRYCPLPSFSAGPAGEEEHLGMGREAGGH